MTTKELLALAGKAANDKKWLDLIRKSLFTAMDNASRTESQRNASARIDAFDNAVAAYASLPALCAEVEALKKVVDAARAVAAIGFHGTAVDALDAALDAIDAAKEPK